MEGELLDLSSGLEAARAETKKAEEALTEKTQVALEKGKRTISEYKNSCAFSSVYKDQGRLLMNTSTEMAIDLVLFCFVCHNRSAYVNPFGY